MLELQYYALEIAIRLQKRTGQDDAMNNFMNSKICILLAALTRDVNQLLHSSAHLLKDLYNFLTVQDIETMKKLDNLWNDTKVDFYKELNAYGDLNDLYLDE